MAAVTNGQKMIISRVINGSRIAQVRAIPKNSVFSAIPAIAPGVFRKRSTAATGI